MEKTKDHYELMRDMKNNVSYFHCYWEDSQGIYSEKELKTFFEEVGQGYEFDPNSTQKNSDCIGWTIYHYERKLVRKDPNNTTKKSDSFVTTTVATDLDSLYWVIDTLNEMENIEAIGICHNMRIRKIL